MSATNLEDFGLSAVSVCALEVEVRDSSGRLPQGNVFPVLEHLASGARWRSIRYVRRFNGFAFRDLPAGQFLLRIASAHHDPVEMTFDLAAGEERRLRVDLVKNARTAPLILTFDPKDIATASSDTHLGARLLSALLLDPAMIAAIEAPLDRFGDIDGIEAHHLHRLLTLGFPRPTRPLAERLLWSIVDHRSRLELVLRALFLNAAVVEVLDCDPAQVPREARIAVDSLDRLDIADALMILALRIAPWKSVMGEVCRSQAGIRDVLIPAGLGEMLVPDPDPVLPVRSFARGRWSGGPHDQTATEAGPLLARLVLVIAGAQEGQLAQNALFGPLLANVMQGGRR